MINTNSSQQITKIYLVTNCYGDPNKVYIGKTKNSRISPHKTKFGDKITYDYIDEVNSLNSKDWKPLECFWIEYFRFLGFDIQNKNNGGNGMDFVTEENRLRISLGRRYKTPIIQYDLEGNFIKEWKSPTEVEENIGIIKCGISSCCTGNYKTAGGFIWRYKKDPINNFIKNKWKGKSIIQYNLYGDFIKRWDRIVDIKIELGYNDGAISSCCRGIQNSSQGYLWRYESDPLPKDYIFPKNKGVSVLQYDLNNNFIKRWERMIDVKEHLGLNPNGISDCCYGKLKTSQGFIWKKENIL